MKKIFFTIAFISALSVQYLFAQDSIKLQPAALINSYFDIKNALVNSDAPTAAIQAGEFAKTVNSIDLNTMTEDDRKAFVLLKDKLSFDARHISESKSIEHQREHFANLSENVYSLAKKVRLSDQPIYREFCPMKKSYWLTNETAIKNPYYGKSMLTCGKVTQTLK